MTETQLTARLVKAWRKMNADVLNITGSAFQSPGWPDICIRHSIWSGFIEFKGEKTVLQKHQARIIKRLKEGFNVVIVRFKGQRNSSWAFQTENVDGSILASFFLTGTDGRVAADLLRTLSNDS